MSSSKNASSFSGKVAVVTGASSGIGAEVAKYLAARGAKVVLAARNAKLLQQVADEIGDSSRVLVHVADVTKKAEHEKLLAAAVAKFGKVNVWINNAGAGVIKTFDETTEEDFDNMFNVNVKSVLFGTQIATRHFKTHSTSTDSETVVINVSSVLGRWPIFSTLAAYNAAKHAVNSLTTNARVDLQNEGHKHVHVLLYSPGLVVTEFNKNAGVSEGAIDMSNAQSSLEVAEQLGRMILNPVGNADVYSRDVYKSAVIGYLSADDVRTHESQAPFAKA